MRARNYLFIALVGYGAWSAFKGRPVDTGPGALAPGRPQQEKTASTEQRFKGYRLVPLADYHLEARVLSTQHYTLGREAELSPVDLALGWGRMSDRQVLDRLDISQGNRFYYWRYQGEPPIPHDEIIRSSSNHHMIPADETIARQLKAIRPGQLVEFSGQLVEARHDDGWRWKSSLSREDTGNGACELVLVQRLNIR
ncbi:MAG: hypothetical protein PHI49_04125 [Halothiobacillaceae bacterium]|jgi:hypothetical protein|nr:hypothetical protein [Halothiobacillaceae bacterium]